ncbi:transmembrane protein 272-like [Corticium candelabrum]|uniref:transmembrane protein 272-like n=1 Tax=Corticium candelabrum TaxID=121492 RepID=UPI002E26BD58|nr:transmembrane protein 272-like [Corticium candelabrum]
MSAESDEAPPSYNSLFPDKMKPNQIGRNLRRGLSLGGSDESETGGKGCVHFIASLGCLLFIVGIALGIPITMIVIGASNLDDCPIERYIPIWLIVMGVFQMIETIFRTCFHGSRNDEDESQGSVDPVACFLCAWFIAGNVWVFRNWNEYTSVKMMNVTNITSSNYCDDLTMKFSFGIIISSYLLVGGIILCFCLCCCCFLKNDS